MATVAMVTMLVVAACGGGEGTPVPVGPGASSAGIERLAAGLASGSLMSGSSSQQSGIWANGTGTVVTTPDVVALNFSVEARAGTVAPARAEAAAAMDAVLTSLRGHGVEDRDIKTTSFRIQPITTRKERTVGGLREVETVIVGYQVTNAAVAKVRDIDGVGVIIDDVAAAGGDAIRINGISFTVDDPKPLETQARELALTDAIAKAQQIAHVAGVTLGSPTLITESGGAPIVARAESFAVAGAPAAPTPIGAGEMEITVRVQMAFSIQ